VQQNILYFHYACDFSAFLGPTIFIVNALLQFIKQNNNNRFVQHH